MTQMQVTPQEINLHIVTLFTNKSQKARALAAQALTQLGLSNLDVLIAATTNKDYRIRAGAAKALGDIPNSRAVDCLMARLNDKNITVRNAVGLALAKQGDVRTLPALIASTKKGVVTAGQLQALERFGGAEANKIVAEVKRKQKRSQLILTAGVGAVILILGIFFTVRALVQSAQAEPFKGKLNDYLTVSSFMKEADPNVQPYLTGKVIILNKPESKIDDTFFDLPENLRATKPEEVGTIVWLEWDKEVKGRYTGGAPAYMQTVKVTLIDKTTGTILQRTTLRGSNPPTSIKSSASAGYGSKPTEELKTYLLGLPQK